MGKSMKMKLTFEGDSHEDKEEFQSLIQVQDILRAVHDAKYIIRNRAKHGNDLSDEEIFTLEKISDALYVESIDI